MRVKFLNMKKKTKKGPDFQDLYLTEIMRRIWVASYDLHLAQISKEGGNL